MNNKLEVIGIDHGWSMMKTISQVFVTGVKEITTTPALFGDVLEYEGKFYKVGTVRQEVKDTKVEDDSFYLLTLAAVAKELKRRGLAEAKVFLAVGLPLTRFGAEKNDFIKYLTKNKRVSFKYENESYHIEIDDVAVFPQCYAAVVDKIPAMAKKTLIVDIGSWTIDIMPVINKSPDESKCVTIPKGLITCMRSINEQCVRQLNGEVDESEIQNIMRYGRSDIDDEYFAIIKAEIEDFVDKVYNSIREFGYNLKTTGIVITDLKGSEGLNKVVNYPGYGAHFRTQGSGTLTVYGVLTATDSSTGVTYAVGGEQINGLYYSPAWEANNTSANAIRRGTGTTDSSGKFEIDISLPPGIGVYSYYGSTSTHYFDICGVSVSPSDDSSISASETIFHLAYTMYHPF